VVCAALHGEEDGDIYIPDDLSYRLTVERRLLVTEPMETPQGRGGHGKHGEWWWRGAVPADVAVESVREGTA
jgi:hypothetical protein